MLSTIDLVELEVLRITSAPPAAARLFPSRTISSAPRSRISLSLSGECEIAIVSKPAISHSPDKDKLIRDLGADEIVRDGKSLAADNFIRAEITDQLVFIGRVRN